MGMQPGKPAHHQLCGKGCSAEMQELRPPADWAKGNLPDPGALELESTLPLWHQLDQPTPGHLLPCCACGSALQLGCVARWGPGRAVVQEDALPLQDSP